VPICIQIIVFAANNHPLRGVGKNNAAALSAIVEVGRASERRRELDCGNECYFSHTLPLVEFLFIYFLQRPMILLRLAALSGIGYVTTIAIIFQLLPPNYFLLC
jgi:hypothetical protein